MSLTDSSLTLSVAQAVTATAFSTNTIDLGPARDIGAGEENHVLIRVGTTVTAAGAATVNFQIVTSASANLSTPTIIGQTDAIPKASLVAGALIHIPLPASFINNLGQRYLGLQFTVGTGPLTAGTFDVLIVRDVPKLSNAVYPSGFIDTSANPGSPNGVMRGFSIR